MEATAKYFPSGRKDCRERLQDSICVLSSAFQCRGLRQSGYYSQYFLVPKKDGREVPSDFGSLQVKPLLRTYKFKMLTIKMIVQIQSGDWFVTINLKDASEGFPHRNFSTAQEVPEVCFRG